MRWKKKEHILWREKTWFAIIPVKIGKNTRWLEKVTVRQYYESVFERYTNTQFLNE